MMKLSKSHNQSEYLSLIFLVVLFVFSGLTVGKLVGYAMKSSSSQSGIEANAITNESPEENLKKYREQNKEVAKALKDKNLFYEPPPPPKPPSSCQAIFGDEAYIDGKWVKVGATLKAGAKLVAIEATYVVIEHDGKEKKLAPIAVAESPRPGSVVAKGSAAKGSLKPGTENKTVTKKGGGATAKPLGGGLEDLSWFDAEVSPETRAKLERLWAIMPDAMKQKAKEDWLKMTDEQKEKAIKELENMPDNMDEILEREMGRRNR